MLAQVLPTEPTDCAIRSNGCKIPALRSSVQSAANEGSEPSLPRNFPCYFSESNFRWWPFPDDISNLTDKGSQMNLFSIRVITENVEQITAFYETVTGVPRTQSQPVFAEIFTDQGILAIGNSQTLSFFDGVDSIKSATNRSMIRNSQAPQPIMGFCQF